MKKVRLGEVCDILDNKRIPITAAKRISGPYPYYGANGVQDYVADYIFDDELVLLAEDGGYFGSKDKPIAYRVSGKCWVNNHAHVLKPKNNINVDYLCYSLMFYDVSSLINGATRQKLTQADMLCIEIPICSIEKQNNIVQLLNKVSDLIALRKQQLAKLDELVKSRFVEMFGDKNQNIIFKRQRIGDLTTIKSGGTPERKIDAYWREGTIPWVKTTELKNAEIVDTEEKITEFGLKNSAAKIVPANTILIAMYGQGKTRGMTGLLKCNAATNQACACLLPSNKICQQYLWQVLIQSYDELRQLAAGSGQPNLNVSMIANFEVLIPPVILQEQFVVFIGRVNKTKSAIQKSLEEMQLLFDSLMQTYFG